MKASEAKVGDKITIEGREGDLGGEHTVVSTNALGIAVRHPDYTISFFIDNDTTVYKVKKTLNKS